MSVVSFDEEVPDLCGFPPDEVVIDDVPVQRPAAVVLPAEKAAAPAEPEGEKVQAAAKRGRRKSEDPLPAPIPMPEGRMGELLEEMKTALRDDVGYGLTWSDVVLESAIMFGDKPRKLVDLVRWFHDKCKLAADMSLAGVRAKELQLGNALQMITSALTCARQHEIQMAAQKLTYLARVADRRKSKDVIEAELLATNAEFAKVRGIWLSSYLNVKFWESMHDLVSETLDRLKQVSITLAAEAKIDGALNQAVPQQRAERF